MKTVNLQLRGAGLLPGDGGKALRTLFSVDTQCPAHTDSWDRGLLRENDGNGTILFFFFFLLLAIPWHMEFPGQGSDPSHSCNLSCSCSNATSLTHRTRPGIEPVSQHSQDAAADPAVPQQELRHSTILNCDSKRKLEGSLRQSSPNSYFYS